MPRLLALGLLAALLAVTALPAAAQTTPTDSSAVRMDSTSAATDSTAAPRVIVQDPETARELFREGNTLLTADNGEGALAKYDEALLYNPAYARAALGRAQALAKLSRFEDARTAYQTAIRMAGTADDAEARATAQRGLTQLTNALGRQASAADQGAKVQSATSMLQADPVSPAAAAQAYALLEEARTSGYDANLVAFFYAKALNVMGRHADAATYAQAAVTASEGQPDRSAFYIQLGLAHMGAGDKDAARTAFEAAKAGAWASWAEHYITQLDAPAGG